MIKTILNYSLLIYPTLLLVLLLVKSKAMAKGEYREDFFDYNNSKSLKVIATFGVLMHHLTQLITDYGNVNKGPIGIFNSMGILFVSIFFFSSGYGLINSYLHKENYLKGFFLKRFVKIIVPFAVLNIVYILPGLADDRIRSIPELLMSLFGITLINTNAWFVVEIAILYLAFYLSFRFIKDIRKATVVVTFIAFIMMVVGFLLGHDFSQLNGHWFMGEWWYNTVMIFPLGLIVGLNKDKLMNLFKKKYALWLVLAIVLFVVSFVVEEYVLNHFGYYTETYISMGYPDKLLTLISQLVLCTIFIFMLLAVGMKVKFGNKIITFFAPFGMEIYLLQDLFFRGYGGLNIMPDVVYWLTIILALLIISVGLYYFDYFVVTTIVGYSNGDFDEGDTIEKREENRKKKLIIKRIILACIILGAATFVCVVGSVYINTIGRSKLVEEEVSAIANAVPGDTVTFGHIDRDVVEWVVLDKKDGKALLLTKYVVGEMAYNQKHMEVSYDDSTLQEYLSEDAYNQVFYPGEREHMLADEAVGDFVFLLSVDEVSKYYPNKDDRITHHYLARPVNGTYKASWWWLRMEEVTMTPTVVFLDGELTPDYKNVNTATGGIRPAIWVEY